MGRLEPAALRVLFDYKMEAAPRTVIQPRGGAREDAAPPAEPEPRR